MMAILSMASLLAASTSLLAAPVSAGKQEALGVVTSQAEEDALVARVEARIRYALNQPQHRTAAHPFGVLPMHDIIESDDAEHSDEEEDSAPGLSTTWRGMEQLRSSQGRAMLMNNGKERSFLKQCPKGKKGKTCRQAKKAEKQEKKEKKKEKQQKKKERQEKKKEMKKRRRKLSVESITSDEVTCIARTTVKEVTKAQDAEIHASAVAEAFKLACDKGDDVVVDDFDTVFKSKNAFAFAKTMAKVMLKCAGTTKKVYKCVSITATANAYAEATATAHAAAVTNAVNACGCFTEAVASALVSADSYSKLVAEAASTATAEVCVKGTKLVKAKAYDSCISSVYGKLFAEATAEAIVLGDCLSAAAVGEVLAEAALEVNARSTCGQTAEAMQFDPNTDGPIADGGPDEAIEVASQPLDDPEEERKAEALADVVALATQIVDDPQNFVALTGFDSP